jgi:hypothetical protein
LARPEEASSSRQSSLSLSLPFRDPLRWRRRWPGLPNRRQPPMRFVAPSASSRCLAATHPEGNQPSSTGPLSVSHALRALFRQTPAGLVSCRSRPWGCTLQGRNPLTEPHLLSEVVALMRFTDRAATVPGSMASSSPWERLESTVAPDDGTTYDQPYCRALLPMSVCTSEPVV